MRVHGAFGYFVVSQDAGTELGARFYIEDWSLRLLPGLGV